MIKPRKGCLAASGLASLEATLGVESGKGNPAKAVRIHPRYLCGPYQFLRDVLRTTKRVIDGDAGFAQRGARRSGVSSHLDVWRCGALVWRLQTAMPPAILLAAGLAMLPATVGWMCGAGRFFLWPSHAGPVREPLQTRVLFLAAEV